MTKLVPEAVVHVDSVEWRPWDKTQRDAPFVAHETNGGSAWVKVLSRDPDTGAESLIYKLDPGWSAGALKNTVYENLFVLDGEIDVDGQTLRKYAYSYRPEGHKTGPVSTATGVSILAMAGAVGEPSSRVPVLHIDVEAMPWTPRRPTTDRRWTDKGARIYIKVLRADEENLDTFYMTRGIAGFSADGLHSHDGPEEAYFLDGKFLFHDAVTGGRLLGTAGLYVHRPPNSVHGDITIVEDHTVFKHDYFIHEDGGEGSDAELVYAAFPRETAAVKALREGRDPQLPPRW